MSQLGQHFVEILSVLALFVNDMAMELMGEPLVRRRAYNNGDDEHPTTGAKARQGQQAQEELEHPHQPVACAPRQNVSHL